MSLFDINYYSKAIEWLAPNKRLPKIAGYVQALITPVQWCVNKFFAQYQNGANYPVWNPYVVNFLGPGYAANAIIQWKQVVYISLVDGNKDAPPSGKWQIYLPSFLGTNERVKFNGNKLVLEFALNQYFQVYHTNFRQPGLLGYYYPTDTPGTPTAGDSDHLLHSDIFILNNPYLIVGFNVGTRDFIPKNWVSGGPYTANLSKVMHGSPAHEYLCTASNTDASFTSGNWSDLGSLPSGYILTAGVVTKDIIDTVDYTIWTSSNYTTSSPPVIYQDFIYVCIKNTTNSQTPDNKTYWFKIDGIGYNNPFLLADNFTVYFPASVYALTNDSEINNFIKGLAYAGVHWSIETYA